MTTSYFQRKKSEHYSFDLFFSKITKSYEKVSLFVICDLNRQNFSFAVDISVIYWKSLGLKLWEENYTKSVS